MAELDLSSLQTEGRNLRTMNIDSISTLDMCQVINEEDATVAQAVQRCVPEIAATIDAVAPRIRKGGRLIYVGAGTSGRLGILDASEIPPTFSAPSTQFVGIIAGGDSAIRTAQEGVEDSHSLAISDLESLFMDPSLDTVLGIAASGRTPYVLACLRFAKEKGCLTVGIACVSGSEIQQEGNVDHVIEVVTGPEVITGSTRLKAGTGTKMVLNMLSTGVMVKVGKTYGNMMVDMKASNLKLKQRSRNIIRSLESRASEISDELLDERIQECGGSVKLALMTLMTGCEKQQCEDNLKQAGGVLSTALQILNATASNNISNGTSTPRNTAPKRKLAVCIDGGGSKCAVALSDEAGNIGRGESGPCNVTDFGVKRMSKVVTQATQQALGDLCPAQPGMEWGQDQSSWKEKIAFTQIRAGMAGFDRPGISALIEEALSDLFNISIGPNLRVTNDVDLLASAIEKHPRAKTGIVLVAGTGSVAMSYRVESGVAVRTGRAGGWGAVLGDGGSGFDIGRMAAQHTLSALESARLGTGSRKVTLKDVLSPLCVQILEKLQISEGSDVSVDVLSHILTAESAEGSSLKLQMASLAPTVLDASSYDTEAISIVHRAVDNLTSTVLRLVRPESVVPAESVLILAGGLIKSAVYRKFLTEKLGELDVVFESIDVVEDGALAGLMSLT